MDSYLGEIVLVAFSYAPNGWLKCQGQYLPIAQNSALFSLLGTTYGGDGMSTFRLPTIIAPTGLNYIICIQGSFPSHD